MPATTREKKARARPRLLKVTIVLANAPNTPAGHRAIYIDASPPSTAQLPLEDTAMVIMEKLRRNNLIECCARHVLQCKKLSNTEENTIFTDAALYGDGLSRQVLCKQCQHCKEFIFATTTSKIILNGDTKSQSLIVK